MSTSPVIHFDSATRHAEALRLFILNTKRTIPDILRAEGKQVALKALAFTPPQKGKRQGERRVARDIGKAIRSVQPSAFTSPRLRELAEARNYEGLNAAVKAIGGGITVDSDGSKVSISEFVPFDPKWHESARGSRGRVFSNKRIGTLDTESHRDYVKKVQGRVGFARAGWAPAVTGLGGKVAAYIARHRAAGYLEDKSGDPVRAYIRMVNQTPWAGYRDEADRVVNNALKSRADILNRKMLETATGELKKQLEKISTAFRRNADDPF